MEQKINALGWICPKPIIETKKLLDAMREGKVTTSVDDRLAVTNLISFAESMGYLVTCEEKGDSVDVTVEKTWSEYDDITTYTGDLVVQITTDSYGTESEGLGNNLMQMYIYSLTEVKPRPNTLLFMNKGAFLTAEGSPVLDSLKTLQAGGVEILTCGACINFFSLDETPEVGGVTNMYAMVEKINNSRNAIVI